MKEASSTLKKAGLTVLGIMAAIFAVSIAWFLRQSAYYGEAERIVNGPVIELRNSSLERQREQGKLPETLEDAYELLSENHRTQLRRYHARWNADREPMFQVAINWKFEVALKRDGRILWIVSGHENEFPQLKN